MNRIFLFLLTNIAILAVFSVTMRLLGVESLLDAQGVNLDYNALLIYAAVLGFSGALVSLALSKWTAKRMTGARVIGEPRDNTERWLVDTVARQAEQAGIGMPEVAIYDAPDMNAFATGARRNNALVAVSSGLLDGMQRGEVEAVLAHEVSHIANGDMVTLALIQGVINTFVIFLSRHRSLCRPRGVQNPPRPWARVLDYGHRRGNHSRGVGLHHRHVVQPPARVPR